MRITETFVVAAPPEAVFDYITNPANLAEWQTSKTSVEQLTEGTPRLGTRVRERTKPRFGREFEQIVEFTEFDRPSRLHAHVVRGPYPIDGNWALVADGEGTRVRFMADGELRGVMRYLEPIVKRVMTSEFATYHRNLREKLESSAPES